MAKRRSFSDKFKATAVLEALREYKTAQEVEAPPQKKVARVYNEESDGPEMAIKRPKPEYIVVNLR